MAARSDDANVSKGFQGACDPPPQAAGRLALPATTPLVSHLDVAIVYRSWQVFEAPVFHEYISLVFGLLARAAAEVATPSGPQFGELSGRQRPRCADKRMSPQGWCRRASGCRKHRPKGRCCAGRCASTATIRHRTKSPRFFLSPPFPSNTQKRRRALGAAGCHASTQPAHSLACTPGSCSRVDAGSNNSGADLGPIWCPSGVRPGVRSGSTWGRAAMISRHPYLLHPGLRAGETHDSTSGPQTHTPPGAAHKRAARSSGPQAGAAHGPSQRTGRCDPSELVRGRCGVEPVRGSSGADSVPIHPLYPTGGQRTAISRIRSVASPSAG